MNDKCTLPYARIAAPPRLSCVWLQVARRRAGNTCSGGKQTDAKPIIIEIWSTMGAKVYQTTCTLTGNKTFVDMGNTAPGMYVLQLTDGSGVKYHFKFVVQ